MVHSSHYDSPLGGIFLSADEIGLTELRFGMQENAPPEGDTPILASAKQWLDIYFSGQEPDFTRRSTPWAQPSRWRCGKFSAPFPMASPLLTAKLPENLQPGGASPNCPPRRWGCCGAE